MIGDGPDVSFLFLQMQTMFFIFYIFINEKLVFLYDALFRTIEILDITMRNKTHKNSINSNIIIIISIKQSLSNAYARSKKTQYKGPFCINYRERGSHARGVYHTVYLAHGNSKDEA